MTEGVFVEEQGVEEVVPVSGKPGRHQWLESTESPAALRLARYADQRSPLYMDGCASLLSVKMLRRRMGLFIPRRAA
jgi:hypothetical protein